VILNVVAMADWARAAMAINLGSEKLYKMTRRLIHKNKKTKSFANSFLFFN
jgi:hypothetical protein